MKKFLLNNIQLIDAAVMALAKRYMIKSAPVIMNFTLTMIL